MKIMAFLDLHKEPEALKGLLRKIDAEKPEMVLNCGDYSLFGERHEGIFEELSPRARPVPLLGQFWLAPKVSSFRSDRNILSSIGQSRSPEPPPPPRLRCFFEKAYLT